MITFKAKTASGEIIKSALSPFNFPAGEAHLKKEPQRDLEPTEIAIIQPSAESLHGDLFQLSMWDAYLTGKTDIKRVLVIPYFPGARADRVSPGVEEPFGLRAYAEFIGSMMIDQIIIFDPHSPETVKELKLADQGTTVTVVESDELFSLPHIKEEFESYTGVIAPDKGAVARSGAVAKSLGVPLYTAEKTRDPETGKLSGFKLELPDSSFDKDEFFIIVDDICDGGGTFLGLESAIGLGYGKVDLFVSHGVFSKNAIDNLSGSFEYVYTTNSFNPSRELPDYQFERFDVIRLLLSKIK